MQMSWVLSCVLGSLLYLGFPPASQIALDAFLQAAVLSLSQLGSADCNESDSNGADCSGAPPSAAHRDTLI